MKKVWQFIRGHYEIIGYCILTFLLFLSCFFRVFALITAIYILAFAILLRDETKVIGLFLFFYCFDEGLFLNNKGFYAIVCHVSKCLVFIIGLIYLTRVIKKKTKINWKLLTPILMFFVYIILPFHDWNLGSLYRVMAFFAIFYIGFVERKKINFKYLVRVFVYGLIISCVFGLFKNISPLLQDKIPTVYLKEKIRFQGLLMHPNLIAIAIVIAISAILFLEYQKKISLFEFFVQFITLSIFGYLTLSRSFIFSVVLSLGSFTIFYILKYRAKAIPLLCSIFICYCLITLIFLNQFKSSFERFDEGFFDYYADSQQNSIEFEDNSTLNNNQSIPYSSGVLQGKTQEEIDKIFAGEIHFDPGRKGLWELYLKDWSSSQKTIWFGRGSLKSEKIGQASAHNLYIQLLWEHGIIGCLFYLAIIVCLIDWKKIKFKYIKQYLSTLIIIIPFFLITLVEHRLYDIVSFLLILSSFGFIEQLQNKEENTESNNNSKTTNINDKEMKK